MLATDPPMHPRRHVDVFDAATRRQLHDYLELPGWESGWKSNAKRDGLTFFHKHYAGYRKAPDGAPAPCEDELRETAPLIFAAWQHVRDSVFAGHRLVRCYANGMAYGMDGSVHTDSLRAGSYTAVYYPHARWSPNWGGETMFYNTEETELIDCVFPQPNSMVVFDGRIPHRAAGVARIFAGLRITLMFKTELRDAPALA